MTHKIVDYYGDFLSYAQSYYEEVKKIAYRSDVDIVGHIDLLTKFNENEEFIDFDDQEYLKLAYECIDMLIDKRKFLKSIQGLLPEDKEKHLIHIIYY